MKTGLLILFSALSLIYTSSVTVPISAQNDNPSLEDLLEIAKEKVAQIKSEYTLSNATSEKFSKHLSNITLSQEQIKEVEAVRDIILYPCTQRASENKNPGSLCDAFADYLVDKCKRFDNLLAFCFGGFLGEYETARNLQLSCIASPPLYNDKKGIESCLTVVPLNSSYTDLPSVLSLGGFHVDSSGTKIQLDVRNPGYRPYVFENITYNIFQGGKKLVSGCIDHKSPCISSNSIGVLPNSTGSYNIDNEVNTAQNPSKEFIVNGTYYYHFFPNSKSVGQSFSYKHTRESCSIISLEC